VFSERRAHGGFFVFVEEAERDAKEDGVAIEGIGTTGTMVKNRAGARLHHGLPEMCIARPSIYKYIVDN